MFLIFVSLKTCTDMDSGLYTVLSHFAPAFFFPLREDFAIGENIVYTLPQHNCVIFYKFNT